MDAPVALDAQALDAALEQLLDHGDDLDGMLATIRARLVALALGRASGDRAAAARRLKIAEL
jgi:hypothetical protein